MSTVGDMRSIFIAARILGGAIHITTENDITARKRRDVFFIAVSISLYFVSLVAINVYILPYVDTDAKVVFFNFARVILFYSCFFTDASLTTLWNRKIRAVLSELRNFDRVTDFRDSSKRRRVRNMCHGFMFVTLIYWTIVGYLSYRLEVRLPLLRGIAYAVVDASIFLQIMIFAGFSFLIGERFRQLCNILKFTAEKEKLMMSDRLSVRFTLQKIWWLHCSLVNAAEMLNSVYAVQLLLWISSLSLNTMSRIYAMKSYNLSNYGMIRETMLAISCAWNVLLVTASCHVTAYQIIFAESFRQDKSYQYLENLEAAAYFQLRKLHFCTVAGFIRVDLPLLLSVRFRAGSGSWD
ncbi:hypothetical protein WN55_06358 [Dufourea novaeangliae]|uniref:Gustatory receptor n=1 Tax=Dufourea novaeangliae TaxID=178035 RepID=A0A154PQD4_DUFNO|nr:hypothetical protein WN55_06358 [Dufourea novaeangliae]